MKRTYSQSKTPTQKTITFKDAAALLGISTATIRNWVKLGKINAISERPLLFSAKEISAMHKKLEKNEFLKSRRNKTRSADNFIPKNYISCSSPNYNAIKTILDEASDTDECSNTLIFHYAKELLESRGIPASITDVLLKPFVSDPFEAETPSLEFISGEDTLGMLYLSLRRMQEKKSTGSYYTPFFVVDRLINDVLEGDSSFSTKDIKSATICDPACGSGNFLLRLPMDVPLENIYGSDIDQTAVYIARINLALKYGIKTDRELEILTNNLTVRDFLKDNEPSKYDLITGNPPWGYVFPKEEIVGIKERFSSYYGTKNPESFALFAERAIERLEDSGVLAFLLPETILSAGTHRGIRRYILDNTRVTSITYLGEVFHKVQCPSVILSLLASNSSDAGTIKVDFQRVQKESLITERSFFRHDYPISEESFHILASHDEQAILDKIISTPHFTLKGQADFALGIVTGSNSTLLKGSNSPEATVNSTSDTALEPILKGKDIEKFHTLPASNYVHFDPEVFQQCAPERFYRADKKLFYRFIAEEPIIALDTDNTLSLNSANILIPKVSGYSPEYIMAVLNSPVISFYYKKTFKNLKVLRSYLEQLPIAECSEKEQSEIAKMAIKIRDSYAEGSNRKRGRSADTPEDLIKELDMRISKLYGLETQ